MRPPRRWVQWVMLTAVLIAPVIVFFVLQATISETRSGSVDEVWFVNTDDGPRLIARDQIAVGSERAVKLRHRLAMVDLTTGARVARRKVDAALTFVGASPAGLWFRRKGEESDLHVRSVRTLERLSSRDSPPPNSSPRPSDARPVTSEVTLDGSNSLFATASRIVHSSGRILDGGEFVDSAFLVDAATGQPLTFVEPSSALVVSRAGDGLALTRLAADGAKLWRAQMPRQRSVRAASRVGEVVVVITSGVARDFALAIDLQTGATRWVHHF
jgi:hypothetical protein